jgi:DNA (cytosine-5)-methyltransferase 1
MTATITRRGTTVDAIDLFCGYGGSSQGIHAAGAEVKVAANHNQKAIDCHAANYPDVDHRRADLSDPNEADYVDPADLPPATFMWASPSCKFHSLANAKKLYELGPQGFLPGLEPEDEFDQVAYANSERSRVTMLCPLRYAARHHPEMVVVENVVEAAKWGPARDGSTFRWWLAEWEKIGYEHEELFLNSMHFPPCPQSRDRMYVVCWRKGNRRPDLDYRPQALCCSDRCQGTMVEAVQTWKQPTAVWPLPRWGKYRQQYTYTCPECRATVEPVAWPAYSAIDWTRLGPAIGERSSVGMQPLADKTMARIRRGLTKFRGGPPIIIPAKSVWGSDRPVTFPSQTQTGQQDKALVTAFMVKNHGDMSEAKYRAKAISDPAGTLTSIGRHYLATSAMTMANRTNATGDPVTAPARTATTAHGAGLTLATEGVAVVRAGNTYERDGSTCRSRPLSEPIWSQHTSPAFGFAHVPFMVEQRGGGSVQSGQRPVTAPAHTVTGQGMHHGLLSPAIFAKFNGQPGDTAWHSVDDPFGTITAGGRAGIDSTGLVFLPWLDDYRANPKMISEQLATVMTHARMAYAASPDYDLVEVTDEDLERVRYRMLDPDPELRRVCAFGDEYILLGTKTEMTAGLGNAVSPPVATWITGQAIASLDSRAAA